MSGWISIHRAIRNHWIWGRDFNKYQAWCDLLLSANHKDAAIIIKNQTVHLRRGQLARSEVSLSKAWGWSRGRVRRFLDLLISEQMIEQQTTHLTSIITICNYDTYQKNETAAIQLTKSKRNSNQYNNQNTDNNVNNVNKNKNSSDIDFTRATDIQTDWDELGPAEVVILRAGELPVRLKNGNYTEEQIQQIKEKYGIN